MTAFRTLLCLVFAVSALCLPVAAQSQGLAATADRTLATNNLYLSNARSYLGLSLGRSAVGVFGKVGTTYGRNDTSIMGSGLAPGAEQSLGRSYGAGVSYAFTPRLSATLEWDSYDFRFTASGRDPVRSTSLGLQYRY